MYAEDFVWIADALGVHLPNSYAIAMNHYPFLDHENAATFALWDEGGACVEATRAGRAAHAWPETLVQIGERNGEPLLLDCESGRVLAAADGNWRAPVDSWSSTAALILELRDGYRGKLPGMLPRIDSSFRWLDLFDDIPWADSVDPEPGDPLGDGALVRVRQDQADRLTAILEARGLSVMHIDGRAMTDEEAFFDALSVAITGAPGCVDLWVDVGRMLIKVLDQRAAGGLHEAAILWHYCDQATRMQPDMMLEAVVTLETMDIFLDCGSRIRTFYLGEPEHGYYLRINPLS